jgi:AraC family transcriptional regulator, transcriptional activator of pobA
METSTHWLSNKEQTEIPDRTFPINIFHLCGTHSRIIPPHWHDHLEWLAIVKGSFRVTVGTSIEDLHAGDVIFVNSRQIHSAFPIDEDSVLYAVVFNEALLRNSLLDTTEAKYIQPLLQHEIQLPCFYRAEMNVTHQIYDCIHSMVYLFREKSLGYELLIKAGLYASLGHALQYTLLPKSDSRTLKYASVIQPLLLHLSVHFHEPITVEMAARMCCVSPNYFCNLFKKATGKTLLEYIHILRIHEAEKLLRTGLYSIQQVALRVGYSNITYFGRIFKKYKNQTARDYMNSM